VTRACAAIIMVDDTRAAVASALQPEAMAQERIVTSIKEAKDRATQAEGGGGDERVPPHWLLLTGRPLRQFGRSPF
jgi:hypothetical protein